MPGGRKSKYETHVKPYMGAIGAWCRDGVLEKDLCIKLGISEQTLNVYKHKYSELREALRTNKAVADAEVENSLFKNCIDREIEEVTETEFRGRDGETSKVNIVKKRTRKMVTGNVSAQKFWLLNRQPQKYRQRIDVDANLKDVTELEKQKQLLDSLPLAERMKLLDDMDKDE